MKMTRTTLAVLNAFVDAGSRPIYGMQVMKSAGISSGTLYPILDRLETAGWITGSWQDDTTNGPRRRYYELTSSGAEQARHAVRARSQRVGTLRSASGLL